MINKPCTLKASFSDLLAIGDTLRRRNPEAGAYLSVFELVSPDPPIEYSNETENHQCKQ